MQESRLEQTQLLLEKLEMRKLNDILKDLESLRLGDFDDKAAESQGMDKLSLLCEELASRDDFDSWAEALFYTMERLADDVDLGSPGPIVHVLEKWVPQYEQYLYKSIERKPTALAVWMVDRLLRSSIREDSEKWLESLHRVVNNDGATKETIECAEETISDEE